MPPGKARRLDAGRLQTNEGTDKRTNEERADKRADKGAKNEARKKGGEECEECLPLLP